MEENDYVDKLPCAHTYSERKIAATCTKKGYTLCTCTKCGEQTKKDYTELGPHTYEDKVVAPSCTAEGYTEHTCCDDGHTVHTCLICGSSYTDAHTSALGHNWSEKEVNKVIGSEEHIFCSVCGLDFTATGTAIAPHEKAHALAGEGGGSYSRLVPIYKTIIEKICTRCGITG